MAIDLTTNIKTNAPRPLDAKTYVGTGQKYAPQFGALTMNWIPNIYRYEGMKVYDIDTNIEWELIKAEYAQSNMVGYENAGYGYFWKNVSFGATPLFYRSNGTWMNETNTNMTCQTNETITLSAITFGNIKKVQWTIQRAGSVITTSNKETITYVFSTIGTWSVKFKVWDYFGNTLEYSYSMVASAIGVLDVSSFTVTPIAGIKNNTLVTSRNYNFVIETTENIDISLIETFNIEYTDSLDLVTTVPLVNGGTLVSGVVLANSKKIEITNMLSFKSLSLNDNTNFNLTFKLYNNTAITKTATYVSVPKIVINSSLSTISYTLGTTELSTTITLVSTYDDYSSVTGTITINGNIYNLVSTSNKLTFTYSELIPLNPGQYTCPVTLTQNVATGIGANVEIYEASISLSLVVAEPTFLITINVKDDFDIFSQTPSNLEGVFIQAVKNGSNADSGTTNSNGNVILELTSGFHQITVSKANYTTTGSSIFVTQNTTLSYILQPSLAFNSASTNVVSDTLNVLYTLLPLNPNNSYDYYQEQAIIEYSIAGTTIEQYLEDSDFGELDISSPSWSGQLMSITLTVYYKTQEVNTTMTLTIGEAPAYWGVWNFSSDALSDNKEDISGMDYPTITSTYLTESYLSDTADDYVKLFAKPSVLTEIYAEFNSTSIGFYNINGWYWIAFPTSVYSSYINYKADFGGYSAITNNFKVLDITISGLAYKLYLYKGYSGTDSVIGTTNMPMNVYLKTT
jgi:hypothetical protein